MNTGAHRPHHGRLTGWFAVLAYVAAALTFMACGDLEEEAKDEQAEEFYSEKLNKPKQEECNNQGLFWDNYTQPADCSSLALAEWECSEAGFQGRVTGLLGATDAMTSARSFTNSGVEYYQCGESDGTISIVFASQSRTDDFASVRVISETFTVKNNVAITSSTFSSYEDDIAVLEIYGRSAVVDDIGFEASCNQFSISYLLNTENDCSPVAVTTDLDTSGEETVRTWQMKLEDETLVIDGEDTDFDGQLLVDEQTIHCSKFQGTLYSKSGDYIGGFFTIIGSDVIDTLADVNQDNLIGIGFDDKAHCQAFNTDALE